MYKPNNLSRLLGTFTTEAALQTAFPAASNTGATAMIGTAAPYALYQSNGVSWMTQDVGAKISSVTYTAGQVTGFVSNGVPCTLTYDAYGRVSTYTANSITRTVTYNSDGTLASIL